MALKNNKFITCVDIYMSNKSPLKITDEDTIILDNITNKPYLPGTSVAGTFRAYVNENIGKENADLLFGDGIKASKLYVYDSIAEEKKSLEERTGIRIDEKFGVSVKNALFSRKYISEGNKFKLRLKLFSEDQQEKEKLLGMVYKCINGLDKEVIRFGSDKTNGAGIMKIIDVKQCKFDFSKKESLEKYLLEEGEFVSVKSDVISNKEDGFATFIINASTKTSILVRENNSLDYELPDASSIKNRKNEYIIPGSSIKGCIKNRFSKIAKYKQVEELVVEAFGGGEGENNKNIGKIFCEDVKIKEANDNVVYNRIRIDKFTGSVKSGGLLDEKPVSGLLQFSIKYKLNNNEIDNKVIALMIYTIKDLLEGMFQIGSGSAVGRGYLKGENIEFSIGKELYYIDLKGDNHKNRDKITEILLSLA